jgi:hypothetical protein
MRSAASISVFGCGPGGSLERRAAVVHTDRANPPVMAHGGCRMDVIEDYLRDQAAKYRELADKTDDEFIKKELIELAAVCEEVANDIEDRLTSG